MKNLELSCRKSTSFNVWHLTYSCKYIIKYYYATQSWCLAYHLNIQCPRHQRQGCSDLFGHLTCSASHRWGFFIITCGTLLATSGFPFVWAWCPAACKGNRREAMAQGIKDIEVVEVDSEWVTLLFCGRAVPRWREGLGRASLRPDCIEYIICTVLYSYLWFEFRNIYSMFEVWAQVRCSGSVLLER